MKNHCLANIWPKVMKDRYHLRTLKGTPRKTGIQEFFGQTRRLDYVLTEHCDPYGPYVVTDGISVLRSFTDEDRYSYWYWDEEQHEFIVNNISKTQLMQTIGKRYPEGLRGLHPQTLDWSTTPPSTLCSIMEWSADLPWKGDKDWTYLEYLSAHEKFIQAFHNGRNRRVNLT